MSDTVYAIDLKRGKEIWNNNIGNLVTSPVFNEGKVYVSSQDGKIFALDDKDGKIAWSCVCRRCQRNCVCFGC